MGKLKKIGIGIGVVVAVFFVIVIAAAASSQQKEDELKQATKIATETPEQIKGQSIDVSYDELMRT